MLFAVILVNRLQKRKQFGSTAIARFSVSCENTELSAKVNAFILTASSFPW
jgi:hypothetical protein